MREKHLFFDLDRTLWDFEKNSENALRQLFSELKLDEQIKSFYHFHAIYKSVNAELWKKYGKGKISKETLRTTRFADTLKVFEIHDRELSDQLSDQYISVSPFQTALFPNTHETLEQLKNEGYILHIITNGFKEVQYIKLNNSKLDQYFDVIVCSEEAGANKPSPLIFNHALSLAKASKTDSVMIGDDYEVDVQGAIRNGLKGVLFDPHNHHQLPSDEWKIKDLIELQEILPWIYRH